MDAFEFPDLVPDKEPDEHPEKRPKKHPEELINEVKRVRYCFLKTKKPQVRETPICTCGNEFTYRYGTRTHSYRDLPRDNAINAAMKKTARTDAERHLFRKLPDWIRIGP